MGFWDKIKNWLGINKVKALPEGQGNQNISKYKQPVCLTRMDGSNIMIMPIYDRTGNQSYQEVLDHYTGERRLIPQFSITDTNLQNAMSNRGSDITKILMDIDFNLLQDDEYSNQVANVLLSSERLINVVDNEEHYAGQVVQDQEGQLKCTTNLGIIKGLAASRMENAQRFYEMREAQEAERIAAMKENASQIQSQIKTSHAQELSDCPYGDAR